jgi:tetratricopeptide (TPR) repeat protein
MALDSVYERRSILAKKISAGVVDSSVIGSLVSNGRAISEEAILWDFKQELPNPPSYSQSPTEKSKLDAKYAELVKDCVSFYNSYGGYLIIGIKDSKELIGYESGFSPEDLNKRIFGATGVSIETIYRSVNVSVEGTQIQFGLLFIPKRPRGTNPAQFKKQAPESEYGKRAYKASDFYLRERDECRPATSPEDFEFLYGDREVVETTPLLSCLENNLPPRDPELSALRGRDTEITRLWKWLSDPFDPVHILCGLGGLGKTSLAYTFAERVVYIAKPEVQRVVWLGAKRSTFSGISDREIALPRVDFSDIDDMLVELLLETGCPPDQLPDQPSRDELLHLAQQHLSEFGYLLFIDNVDTLPDEDQRLVFHLLTQLCSMSRTKAVLTARKNLGASPNVYTQIAGIDGNDFSLLVSDKATLLGIRPPNEAELILLREASGGSPLFVQSLLRLVALGDRYRDAILNWRGNDGDAVRQAAFEREIASLQANDARVLLALGYMGNASALELSSILSLNRYEVQSALDSLRSLSMTEQEMSLPGGATFKLPASLALINSLLEKRVGGWQKIRSDCRALVKVRENKTPYVGQAITRAVAQLRAGDPEGAALTARESLKLLPDNADLHCLLARCLVEAKAPGAEAEFQKAFELGCRKRDLFDGWLLARESVGDWRGVADIANTAELALKSTRYCISRNRALIQVGDELARAGKYNQSGDTYLSALADLNRAIGAYHYAPDRRMLFELREKLVMRWLGVVKLEADQDVEGMRRLVGAYYKAITTFGYWKEEAFRSLLTAASAWMSRVSSRKAVSETSRERMETMRGRVLDLRERVEKRPSMDGDFAAAYVRSSTALIAEIDQYLSA